MISLRILKAKTSLATLFFSFFGLVTALIIQLDFLVFSRDGYNLWLPVINEYLRGEGNYLSAPFIFNGQNLMSIYGELPFWKLFRLLGLSAAQVINLTFVVWWGIASFLCFKILSGLRKRLVLSDLSFSILYTLMTPIIVNRLEAGHFNLMFGMLPMLFAIGLVFDKSKSYLLVGFFSFWFAFSTASYQILTYYIFYIPLLAYLIFLYEDRYKVYLIFLVATCLTAFMINFPVFLQMLEFAMGENSLRTMDANVVYSYTVSSHDLPQFLFSKYNRMTSFEGSAVFHELNYGMGVFSILLFYSISGFKRKFIPIIYFLILFAFCANIAPFSYLSELPLIRAFRVPQRVFILPCFLVPLMFIGHKRITFSHAQILSVFIFSLFLFFLPYASLIGFFVLPFMIVPLLMKRSERYKELFIIICFSSLFSNFLSVYYSSKEKFAEWSIARKVMEKIVKMEGDKLESNVYHFFSGKQVLVNAVASSSGIKTLEGYGHPPKKLLEKYNRKNGLEVTSTINTLIFDPNLPNYRRNLKEMGVSRVIDLTDPGDINIYSL